MTSFELDEHLTRHPSNADGDLRNGHRTLTLSIVVPAYCEGDNLSKLYEELVKILVPVVEDAWELILVDDGSSDDTWVEILKLHKKDSKVKGLSFSRNFGHQYALFAGLSSAQGEAVIMMDADLQHPPHVITALLDEWHRGNKIVHAVRADHKDTPWVQKVTSAIFYRLFSFLSGEKLSEGMSDFRLLDRRVLKEILQFQETGLFLRGLVQWMGYPSSKVEYQCRERFAGESKYRVGKRLKLAWSSIISFSMVPLRVGIIVGLITSAFSMYVLIDAVVAKLFTDNAVPGWTSVIGVVSLLFGILFVLLGIVGEYVGRILIEVRRRPRFIINERAGFDSDGGQDSPPKLPRAVISSGRSTGSGQDGG